MVRKQSSTHYWSQTKKLSLSVDSSTSSGHTVMDIALVTLSDLESSDNEFEEF